MAVQQKIALDPVTGLPTLEVFGNALQELVRRQQRRGRPCSLAVIDLDCFGAVNETQGADAADHLLAALAERFSALLSDAGTLYRCGGDAFAALLPGIEKEQAFLLLEQLRAGQENGDDAAVTVSVGLAACPDDGASGEALLHKANEALYRAKVTGRNKVCLAREEKMVTKTSHYMQGQLMGLRRLAERKKIGEAELLREALNDLLRKHNA